MSDINGTPMPGFAQVFEKSPDDIWYLVHFIRDMGERRRRNLPPLQPSAGNVPAGEPAPPPAVEPAAAEPTSKAAALRPKNASIIGGLALRSGPTSALLVP